MHGVTLFLDEADHIGEQAPTMAGPVRLLTIRLLCTASPRATATVTECQDLEERRPGVELGLFRYPAARLAESINALTRFAGLATQKSRAFNVPPCPVRSRRRGRRPRPLPSSAGTSRGQESCGGRRTGRAAAAGTCRP